MKRKYIIRSFEEELGSELFVVTVPKNTTEDEVFKVFDMAAKYANIDAFLDDDEGVAEYDEHYAEMVEAFEGCNGQEMFNTYLELCGYKVEDFDWDFDYEW